MKRHQIELEFEKKGKKKAKHGPEFYTTAIPGIDTV